MGSFKTASLVILLSFLVFSSCQKEELETNTTERITILSETEIQDRITHIETDSIIEVGDNTKSAAHKKFKLKHIADVKSPKLKNVSLRATHISMNGDYAFVSYNHEGPTYLGGLDVIDLKNPKKPKLVSSAIFEDTDVSTVFFDPGTSKLYLATATSDETYSSPSVLEEVILNGNNEPTQVSSRVDVPSYVATDAKVMDNKVLITSGNTGGLSILNQEDLSEIKFMDLEDARAVEYTSSYIIVMQGTPARLNYYHRNDLRLLGSFAFDGATIPEAKSAFCIENSKVYMGAGDKGVIISDIFSDNVVETIPPPEESGVDQEGIQSNSVTIENGLIFIANGEAGVHVAEYDYNSNTATVLGRTQFGKKESANYVVVKNKWLFIARGAWGIQIVQVEN